MHRFGQVLALMGTVVLLMAQTAVAINDKAGTTGYNFLKIGVGARSAALGGAYTAVTGDVESAAWNPAGLWGIQERSAAASYTSYLVDTEAGFLSIASPGQKRVWGASLNYVSYGTLQKTDEDGGDLGTFGAVDLAAYITVAQPVMGGRLAIGASLKAIYSSIDDYSSDAYVVDLGITSRGPIQGMTLGASLANVGTVRSGYTDGYKDSLPVMIRVGMTHSPAHAPAPMLLLADLSWPNDSDLYASFGAEIQVSERLYVRPGYSLQQGGVEGDEALGLTGGAGIVLRRYRLDYAFNSYPALGDVHRISLTGRI